MRIIFEMDGEEEKEAPDKGPHSAGPQDVWRFGEIRETLWGDGSPIAGLGDVWDFPGIRKTLWGR
jgi:hypothetical protein